MNQINLTPEKCRMIISKPVKNLGEYRLHNYAQKINTVSAGAKALLGSLEGLEENEIKDHWLAVYRFVDCTFKSLGQILDVELPLCVDLTKEKATHLNSVPTYSQYTRKILNKSVIGFITIIEGRMRKI